MKTLITSAVLLAGAAQAQEAAQATSPSSAAMVDALNATFGSHAGKRASHAKGVCATAEFVPAPKLSDFVQSPLFAARSIPANVRLSIGGGNPNASDKSRSVRGLSMRLAGRGEQYDLLLISEPVFFAATPASFVSFLQARVPDPATGKPDPARVAAHNAAYPDGTRQPALLAAHAAPSSYATTPYFSNNAFVFTNRRNVKTTARIVVEPEAGTHYLSAEDERSLPDTFLPEELGRRLARGPVGFTLYAQLPAPGDSLVDPSTAWEGAGKVALGRLRITALAAQDSCDGIVYMPLSLPAGIAPGADPILRARGAPYAISFSRRTR
jgi:catalase